MERKVLRQEVLWIPESRRVPFTGIVEGGNLRIWTLYPYTNPDEPPALPYRPAHHHNAFLEDYVHDWNVEKGFLRYYSRAIDSRVWILLEHMESLVRGGRR
jgi:hypothetical protein